jgi:hypothetical protein
MYKFVVEIPDSVYAYEPTMWDKYVNAMQMALNRMAVGYMKYHAERNELFMDCEEDKVAFIRQRLAMYSGSVSEDACDCDKEDDTHSSSCFLVLHAKKLASKNTENLLDIANGCFCEFIRPNLAGAYFRAQDSHESPGIVRT